MAHSGKIFGIGFHKTGTSSLASALRRLGYKTIHGDPRGSWPGADEGRTLTSMIDAGNHRLPTFDLFDAFVDNPYFTIWRGLDEKFPDAKFILTVRDETAWIESCARYYRDRRVRPMRSWMFGRNCDPAAGEAAREAWLDAYRRHNAGILEHFRQPSNRLLVMEIARGDGWEKLCPFLGHPVRNQPFPHSNESCGR